MFIRRSTYNDLCDTIYAQRMKLNAAKDAQRRELNATKDALTGYRAENEGLRVDIKDLEKALTKANVTAYQAQRALRTLRDQTRPATPWYRRWATGGRPGLPFDGRPLGRPRWYRRWSLRRQAAIGIGIALTILWLLSALGAFGPLGSAASILTLWAGVGAATALTLALVCQDQLP